MDNILQQSGNVQVDDDDDDDVNLEYISTTSTAQAICNFLGICPIDSASGIYKDRRSSYEWPKQTWPSSAA